MKNDPVILPSLTQYLDYRHYLADVYKAFTRSDPAFSYRKLARMAGSSSPNWFQLIRDRKLNIQPEHARKLARCLGLSRSERSFLKTIIDFDHAATHDEKDTHFRRILASRAGARVRQLRRSQFEYFSHWYIPVVRELVTGPLYPGKPAWIASRIVPPVSTSRIRKAITLLNSLGLIRPDTTARGRWVLTNTAVSTPSEVLSVAVTKYHRDIIAMGRDAIEAFPPTQRDIRAATVGVSEQGYRELKKRMESFWHEILAFAATQQCGDEVYQVNMQLFPLTRRRRRKR